MEESWRDDDVDALNDETFGDDGDDFNWEDAQNVLADFEKAKPNGKSVGHGHRQHEAEPESGGAQSSPEVDINHGYGEMDERILKDFEDFDNENALEESISRLVMDEFDDEDEEERMKSKLRRLGGTGTSLNTYFLPPQVANKHLQWFMDKELPGGDSLLGTSVWSMHPTTTPSANIPQNHHHHQHHVSNISGQSASNSITTSANHQRHNDPQINTIGPIGHMADARHKIPPNLVIGHPPNASSKKPVFKTVEEIERELLEESSGVSNDSNANHAESVPTINRRPRVITAEELERELISSSIPKQNQESAIPPHHLPQPPQYLFNQSQSTDQGLRQLQQQQQQQQQMVPGSPTSFSSPTRPGMNMNQMMMQQQQRMTPPPPPIHAGSNAALAQRMISNAGMHPQNIPPNIAAQMAFHQQQHIRMLQMNPHLRMRFPVNMPFPPLSHPMRPGFPHNVGMHPQMMRPMRPEDPYRGLMNEKDKQRLRNIAIIQLQNDHPYTTDYYCLMYKVRHGTTDPRGQRSCLEKLFPKKSDENSNRNNYQPAFFENSLGKLQAVSALAPKKAIDTVIRVVDSGPSRGGMKAYRYLLLEVEKLYECLLKIQEADIRKTLLMNANSETMQQRIENTDKVDKVLNSSEKLAEVLSVHKGKMLVSRLIPLMEPPVRFFVFSHMITKFPTWVMPNNSEIDKTYPFLRHCVLSAEMKHLISVFNSDVPSEACRYLVSTKLGVSLLMVAFHKAECIIAGSLPDVAPMLQKQWTDEARWTVLNILMYIEKVPPPIELPQHFLRHMERFRIPYEEMLLLQAALNKWSDLSVPLIQQQ